MYCINCGKEIKDDAVFCMYCGSRAGKVSTVAADPAAGGVANRKKRRGLPLVIGVIVILFALIAGSLVYNNLASTKIRRQMNLGSKYLNEMEYEQAVAVFKGILEIYPDNKDAKDALEKAYIGWTDSLVDAGEHMNAFEVFEDAVETLPDSEKLKDRYIAALRDWIRTIDDEDDIEDAEDILDKAYEQTGSEEIKKIKEKLRKDREKDNEKEEEPVEAVTTPEPIPEETEAEIEVERGYGSIKECNRNADGTYTIVWDNYLPMKEVTYDETDVSRMKIGESVSFDTGKSEGTVTLVISGEDDDNYCYYLEYYPEYYPNSKPSFDDANNEDTWLVRISKRAVNGRCKVENYIITYSANGNEDGFWRECEVSAADGYIHDHTTTVNGDTKVNTLLDPGSNAHEMSRLSDLDQSMDLNEHMSGRDRNYEGCIWWNISMDEGAVLLNEQYYP